MTDEQKRIVITCLMIIAAAVLVAALYFTRSVMIPFVISIFIVSMVSPIVDYQVIKLKFSHSVAVTVALLVVTTAIVALCLFVVGAMQGLGVTAMEYGDSVEGLGENAAGVSEKLGPIAQMLNIEEDRLKQIIKNVSQEISTHLPAWAQQTAGTAMEILSAGFFVILFVIFILAGRDPWAIRKGFYAEMDDQIRRYITTKVVISIVTAGIVWALLAYFGLRFAAMFGLMAFLLNFIPNIGPVIATLLPIPVAFVQFQDPDPEVGFHWMQFINVILWPGLVQTISGNLVEPKIMGQGLELHPVTVVLMLAFWGLLWGMMGAVLAVPMTAVLRIVLMRFDAGKPIGRLLAGELPGSQNNT